MNLKSFIGGFCAVLAMPMVASAAYSDRAFRGEVLTGLDIVGARANVDVVPDTAPGELGADVYEYVGAVRDDNVKLFVPTTMYMRMGGGLTLNFATDGATFDGAKHDTSGYSAQIGLGWNLSSYVRTEIDLQTMTLSFSDLKDFNANYRTASAMLYFDFARRYVQTGDITRRRTFVPFMGVGAGVGYYAFDGALGSDGVAIVAPRAVAGFNIMLNDLIGVDIMYQYQMMIGNGFGWGTDGGGANNISNIMASLRVNF